MLRRITTHERRLPTLSLIITLILLPLASASVIPNPQILEAPTQLWPGYSDLSNPLEEIIYDHSIPSQSHFSRRSDDQQIAVDSSGSSTAIPEPFDSSLGNNFTSPTCAPFITSLSNNATFEACTPLSLLLQTSTSFFSAVRSSPSLLTRTLDATCNVNATDCSLLMSSLNTQLRSSSVCGPDLSRGNPIVTQAAAGFAAYDVLYRAGCLKDAATSDYCYAEAATNVSTPSSGYIYYLPLGLSLPTTARVACTQCLRDTMGIFANDAAKAGTALAGDYLDAAGTVGRFCGTGFANGNVKVASVSAAGMLRTDRTWAAAGMIVALWMVGIG